MSTGNIIFAVVLLVISLWLSNKAYFLGLLGFAFTATFVALNSTRWFHFWGYKDFLAENEWNVVGVCIVIFAIILHLIPFTRRFIKMWSGGDAGDVHGSASWAGRATEKEGEERGNGIPLGWTSKKKLFRVGTHVVSCAPTRSGKDVGGAIPTLLEHKGSCIALDIKGENYAVTHKQREKLGNKVFLIDPFGITGDKSNKFNWLSMIDIEDPDSIGLSLSLADMLVAVDAKSDSHFEDSARVLLQGIILLVAADPDENIRNMATVREILTLPDDDFISLMTGCLDHPSGFKVISRCASKILGTPEKERGSIISTAQRHTAFLDDPRIVEVLSGSDFELDKIKSENMTIFLVLPPDRLRPYRSFVRAFFGLSLSAITKTQKKPEHNVIFILNEFNQLGYMSAIEDGISLVLGYGAQFLIYLQDLSQLKGVYTKWQTFLANSTRQFFGCNDFDTAKYISDSLGSYTTLSTSSSSNKDGTSNTTSQTSRNLLNPDEVMQLAVDQLIILQQAHPPLLLDRITYYEDKHYQGLFEENPFYQ